MRVQLEEETAAEDLDYSKLLHSHPAAAVPDFTVLCVLLGPIRNKNGFAAGDSLSVDASDVKVVQQLGRFMYTWRLPSLDANEAYKAKTYVFFFFFM